MYQNTMILIKSHKIKRKIINLSLSNLCQNVQMSNIFQKRTAANYGDALVTYNATDEWKKGDELKMIYLTARKPTVYFEKWNNTPLWDDFLKTQGVKGPVTMDQGSDLAAAELCSRIITPELLDKISNNIIQQIKDNPDRSLNKVKVIAPFPIDASQTPNKFAPAFAAAITSALELALPEKLKQANLPPLEVIGELDGKKSNQATSILNLVNNSRGATSDPTGDVANGYMERIVRQPVYSGKVDKNAIYVPVDDFLVSQSTVAGLMNYIKSDSGLTTPAVTGFKLFAGIEVMTPKQETLDYLNTAIEGVSKHTLKASGGVEGFKNELNSVLSQAGLSIDFKDPLKNTMSNSELLFVAGYIADGENPTHKKAFETALKAIGSSLDQAKGNSPSDIFHSPPHTVKDIQKVFENTIGSRKEMVEQTHERFTDLVASNKTTTFGGR